MKNKRMISVAERTKNKRMKCVAVKVNKPKRYNQIVCFPYTETKDSNLTTGSIITVFNYKGKEILKFIIEEIENTYQTSPADGTGLFFENVTSGHTVGVMKEKIILETILKNVVY